MDKRIEPWRGVGEDIFLAGWVEGGKHAEVRKEIARVYMSMAGNEITGILGELACQALVLTSGFVGLSKRRLWDFLTSHGSY